MNTIQELKKAIEEGRKIVWLDPEVQDGNDYVISFIEDLNSEELINLNDEDWRDLPITIQYNRGGSEAQVTYDEIKAVLSVDEFMASYGGGYDTLVGLQEENALWIYGIDELSYFQDVIGGNFEFVLIDDFVSFIQTP